MNGLSDLLYEAFDTLDWGATGLIFGDVCYNIIVLTAGAILCFLPFAIIIKIVKGAFQ